MNYGELKTHFEALLNRSDITSSLTETFISQGISRIQRQLRTPLNEKKTTYTFTSKATSVTLPSDFLEIISVYMDGYELSRTTMSQYRQLQKTSATGNAKQFVREQQKLLLFPAPATGEMSLYYYSEFPALSADSDTNNLSTVAPDLIVYAALTYSADYFLDERAEIFEMKYNQFLQEIQEQSNDQELNGGTQVIQPAYQYGD